jgi:hypothetical protein
MFNVKCVKVRDGEATMASWYQRGREDGKEYGEWGSLERGMVKSYQGRVQQKAERSIVMKSGWVESGRRTTLLWHLFGRRTGSYSPRQLVGRHWQLTILQPGGLSHSYSGSRPNFVGNFPSLMLDTVWPWAKIHGSSRVRKLTRFVAGARGCQAMMQVRRRKSGGARPPGGDGGALSHTDVCPTFSGPRT